MTRPSPCPLPVPLLSVLLVAQCPGQEEGRHWFSRGSGATQELVTRERGTLPPLPKGESGVAGAEQGAPPAFMASPAGYLLPSGVQHHRVIKPEEAASPAVSLSFSGPRLGTGAKLKVV